MNAAPDGGFHYVAYSLEYWIEHGSWCVIVAFFIGSIPFGLVVSRLFFKRDIRAAGSGNIGAANALRTMGKGAGIAVLLLDALKGVCATIFPYVSIGNGIVPAGLFDVTGPVAEPEVLCAMCAIAAILGHCYSPWLQWKGGKGVATLLGVFVVAAWPSAITFMVLWLAIVVPTGYASAGSIAGTVAGVAVLALLRGSGSLYFSVPAAAIIVWKHRENIARLIAGNENRLNLLKSGPEPQTRPQGPSAG